MNTRVKPLKISTIGISILASGLILPLAQGGIIYDESTLGDLSGSGLSPTTLAVGSGSNQVLGSTGRGSGGVDRDYFSFTVPAGLELRSVTVLPGTVAGGAVAFIGLEAGPQVTLPTNPSDATGLLGWWHYSAADINSDVLSKMSASGNGSSGFTAPLGAGSYAFWVQDFNAGAFSYGFDFVVGPTSSVPDSGPGAFSSVAVMALALVCGKRFGVARAEC